MRSGIISILLMVSIILAAGLFYLKFKNQYSDIDKVRASLENSKRFLTPGSNVLLDGRQSAEMIFYSRLALAPVRVAFLTTGNKDTILSIHEHHNASADTIAINQILIWHNRDERWDYSLITSK